jgi:hypothetical protein
VWAGLQGFAMAAGSTAAVVKGAVVGGVAGLGLCGSGR